MGAEVFGDEALSSMFVLKSCGEKDCLNPNHFILGGSEDLSKLRISLDSYNRWNGIRNGSANPASKLSDEQVSEIVSSSAPVATLSEFYGVCRTTIWNIRAGVSWRNCRDIAA